MAKWVRKPIYHGDEISGSVDPNWRCSNCGERAPIIPYWYLYDLAEICPNCGEKMEKGGDENAD